MEDGTIPKNPAQSRAVRVPALDREHVVPWPAEQVQAVIDAHPDRWRAVPTLVGGCGLRQGEVFSVGLDDLQFLHRRLLVQTQIRLVHGRPVFARPKGGHTREVPLSDTVAEAWAEHIRQHPPADVRLPWGRP